MVDVFPKRRNNCENKEEEKVEGGESFLFSTWAQLLPVLPPSSILYSRQSNWEMGDPFICAAPPAGTLPQLSDSTPRGVKQIYTCLSVLSEGLFVCVCVFFIAC